MRNKGGFKDAESSLITAPSLIIVITGRAVEESKGRADAEELWRRQHEWGGGDGRLAGQDRGHGGGDQGTEGAEQTLVSSLLLPVHPNKRTIGLVSFKHGCFWW